MGNPGKWGIGGVIRDTRGNWIAGFSQHIPHAINIYTELLALITGIRIALERSIMP